MWHVLICWIGRHTHGHGVAGAEDPTDPMWADLDPVWRWNAGHRSGQMVGRHVAKRRRQGAALRSLASGGKPAAGPGGAGSGALHSASVNDVDGARR
ncbi:hypothetical protein U9M48_024503 [Paspalum notatum var. saurae]|uniref:Uncharacterized protein n=1 Tax=Paspalum notatum var. saurae TaxID=547442 RepID=A0AAQ3TRF3_PASNO